MKNITGLIVLFDDHIHLRAVISALAPLPVLVIVNDRPFVGNRVGDYETSARIAREEGATVHIVSAKGERRHREEALRIAREDPAGWDFAIVADADEVLQAQLRDNLIMLAETGLVDVARVSLETGFWDCQHFVRPPEQIKPAMLINLHTVEYHGCREFRGKKELVLSPEFGCCMHLSWIRPMAAIKAKLEGWGHAADVVPGYLERFVASRVDPLMKHLNPTHPAAYDHIERICKPAELELAWDGNKPWAFPS